MTQEQQVAKVMCLDSLLYFTRYFFKMYQKKKFTVNEHHLIICDALERVLRGELKRLIINVAPRYTKTELAVKSFIAHGLALNPSAKFIHLSYGDDIALDNSEFIKDLVNSAEYQALFPSVQVKKDAKAKDKWWTTDQGGVLARAAGGQVTGFGAGQTDFEEEDIPDFETEEGISDLEKKLQFGGAIIIDDPIKPEDADQDTPRIKVNSRFDSTIRNRVNSRNTPIVIIMQRLHPEDLSGYLQREGEQDKWEVISLPCIKENGTALWPAKHTIEELRLMEVSNELVFQRQYMQNPSPKTGLMFPRQSLHYYKATEMVDKLSDSEFVYIPVDPANLGGDDFAAIVCKLLERKIYVWEVLYNTEGADVNEEETVKLAISSKANAVGVEGVFGWSETVKRIRAALSEKGYEGEVRELRPRTSKHVRITARSRFIINHFYFREDWQQLPQYAKFMRILTAYKKIQEPGKLDKHDEAPDVCEMAANYFERNFPDVWAPQ